MPFNVFDRLYNTIHGITHYVQIVLNRIYQYNKQNINDNLINQVIEELTEEQTPVFQNYLDSMTENQALVAGAIAHEGTVDKPLSNTFITRYHLPSTSSVQAAIMNLENSQFIYQGPQGYYVYDYFFAQWLRNTIWDKLKKQK